MRRPQVSYNSTTLITCSDNGKSVTASVISFIPNQRLVVSFQDSVRMELAFNKKSQLYIGKQGNLEFASGGPMIFT